MALLQSQKFKTTVPFNNNIKDHGATVHVLELTRGHNFLSQILFVVK